MFDLEPCSDAERVHADAKQVRWDKAELRRSQSNYADEQAIDA
jgi:hypothetical protein